MFPPPPWLLLPANNSAVEKLKADNCKAVLSTDERWTDADLPKPYLFQSQHFVLWIILSLSVMNSNKHTYYPFSFLVHCQ